MLRVLVVDDELPARERLKTFLSQNETVELIGEAEDGIAAVESIEAKKPDLVFLDIQMPRLDGFGVIRMLEDPPPVIFTTAYDEYAIKAFEVNAVDYLLKPFSKVRLDEAIEKAVRETSRGTTLNTRLEGLFTMLAEQKRHLERIAVKSQGRILVVDVDKIDTIVAEDGLNFVVIGDKRHQTSYTLRELQERLDPETFFRAHRSALVNLSKVKEIIPWFAGSYKVKLVTGVEVDLSRSQVPKLRKIITW